MAEQDDAPPSSGGRTDLSGEAVTALLARVLTHLDRLDAEKDRMETSLRDVASAIRESQHSTEELTSAVLVVSGRVATLDERTKTFGVMFEAKTVDDYQERREEITLLRRRVSDDLAALQSQVEAVEHQARQRDAEQGSRLGTIEGELGEYPVPEQAGKPAIPGRGWRLQMQTLWEDHRQRTSSRALALGGGALASGPLAWALYELVKLVARMLSGGN